MKNGRGRRAPGRSDRLDWDHRLGWSAEDRVTAPAARVRIAIGRAASRHVQPFDGPGPSTEGYRPGGPGA